MQFKLRYLERLRLTDWGLDYLAGGRAQRKDKTEELWEIKKLEDDVQKLQDAYLVKKQGFDVQQELRERPDKMRMGNYATFDARENDAWMRRIGQLGLQPGVGGNNKMPDQETMDAVRADIKFEDLTRKAGEMHELMNMQLDMNSIKDTATLRNSLLTLRNELFTLSKEQRVDSYIERLRLTAQDATEQGALIYWAKLAREYKLKPIELMEVMKIANNIGSKEQGVVSEKP